MENTQEDIHTKKSDDESYKSQFYPPTECQLLANSNRDHNTLTRHNNLSPRGNYPSSLGGSFNTSSERTRYNVKDQTDPTINTYHD